MLKIKEEHKNIHDKLVKILEEYKNNMKKTTEKQSSEKQSSEKPSSLVKIPEENKNNMKETTPNYKKSGDLHYCIFKHLLLLPFPHKRKKSYTWKIKEP